MRRRFDRVSFLQSGAIVALLIFGFGGSVYAANSDTDAQIQRLENEIQTLSRAVFKGEQPPAGFAAPANDSTQADIQNRLSQMEMNIQVLTGKIEEQGNAISTMKEQMGRSGPSTMSSATPYPTGGTAASSGSTVTPNAAATSPGSYTYAPRTGLPSTGMMQPQPSAVANASGIDTETETANMADNSFTMADPNAAAPVNAPTAGRLDTMVTNVDQNGTASAATGTPTADYEAAFTMIRNQDYAAAQIAFDAFIKKYPTSSLVPNAMYWLGESYYVRNQFVPATKIFAEAYQKYPKSAKAPDDLLKLGLSLAGQGKTKDACVALGQLKKQYPAGSAPVLTRGDQEIERLKCNAQ